MRDWLAGGMFGLHLGRDYGCMTGGILARQFVKDCCTGSIAVQNLVRD